MRAANESSRHQLRGTSAAAVCPTGPQGGHRRHLSFSPISTRGAVLLVLSEFQEPSTHPGWGVSARGSGVRAGARVRALQTAVPGAPLPPRSPCARPDASPGALTDDFSQLSVFSLVSRAAAGK